VSAVTPALRAGGHDMFRMRVDAGHHGLLTDAGT
jgi:hypothetical protein